MFCFGVAYTSPRSFVGILTRCGLLSSPSEVSVIPCGASLQGRDFLKTKKALIFLSTDDAVKNARYLNTPVFNTTYVFIFGSPISLNSLEGCVALDFVQSESRAVSFSRTPIKTTTLKASRSPTLLRRVDRADLDKLIVSVKQGSLLNPLMTLLYTLPSSTHQTPVKEACARYICEALSLDAFFASIYRQGLTLSPKFEYAIRGILSSDEALNYVKFFSTVGRDLGSIPNADLLDLCEAHKTVPYEVKYLSSVCDQSYSTVAGRSHTRINPRDAQAMKRGKAVRAPRRSRR